MTSRVHNQAGGNKLPISRARYQLVPLLSELFAKKSFSGHKLDQVLKENHLGVEDRALFTELFYGFLRYGHQLLYLVDKFLVSPEKMPLKAKWIVAIAFYQKLYLHKIPDHALVNDAVEMAKRFLNSEPIAKAVNAILRKFIQNITRFENLEDEPIWVQTSFPQWLSDRLVQQWGQVKYFEIAQALNARSPTFIRVNPTRISEEKLLILLTQEGIACQQTGVPNCIVLPSLNRSPKDIPGYSEGLWTIQNMGSQRIVPFLELSKGQTVLDACCGFGGKTLQMAELMHDNLNIHFFDSIEKKMQAVTIRAEKMGFKHAKAQSKLEKVYDRILVDAPCSGTGTIASHPEIKWFRTEQDIADLCTKQKEVLAHYSQFLLPGGKLLYAVCSIDKTEGEDIIRSFLATHTDFEIDPSFKTPFIDGEFGATHLPTEKGETGYFLSRLVRKAG